MRGYRVASVEYVQSPKHPYCLNKMLILYIYAPTADVLISPVTQVKTIATDLQTKKHLVFQLTTTVSCTNRGRFFLFDMHLLPFFLFRFFHRTQWSCKTIVSCCRKVKRCMVFQKHRNGCLVFNTCTVNQYSLSIYDCSTVYECELKFFVL